MKTTRRAFVITAGAGVAGGLAGCGGGASPAAPTPTPTPGGAPAELRLPLMAVGQTVAASIQLVAGLTTPLAITRLSDTQVVAVSRICTHQSCTVALPATAGATLDCPCHGSRFRTDGQVVNGPAARPLGSFPTRIEGNEVVVSA